MKKNSIQSNWIPSIKKYKTTNICETSEVSGVTTQA